MVDLAGNAVVPRDTTFTSANGPDIVNPARLFVSILNGATNVPTNPVIESLFNEPIDPVSITPDVRLYDTTTGQNVPSTSTLSADGLRLTLVPDSALEQNRLYYVYKYGLRDLSGNGVVNFFSQFTTGAEEDNDGPVLDDSTLFDGISDVPTNVWIRVRFNEPLSILQLAGVTIEDNAGVDVPANVSLSGDRRTINVVPKDLLAENALFSLNVADIADLSGNLLVSAITQNFTTASGTDLLQGSEVYRSIPYGVTNIPRNATFEVGLSERLDPASLLSGTNSFNLYDTSNGQNVLSTYTISADGLTVNLDPVELLEESRVYYWYVGYSPYLYDLANNFIALNAFSLFTTGTQEDEDAPVLLSSSILDGATNVPVSARVTLTLDEPLSNNCYQSLSLTDGNTDIITSVVLSTDRQTITLTPTSDLAVSTAYTVVFGGICDYAGNTLSGDALSFTTDDSEVADGTAPQISSVVPSSSATGVSVDTNIIITFDETIEADSIVLLFNNAGQLVPGSVNVVGSVLTFTPDDTLATNNQHRIEIRYNIFDLSGNQQYHGDSYFTTEL
jgi:hypothetical protein